MKFSCEKNILYDAISSCAHAVSSKSATPVLEGILITADENVTMCCYNYKTGIKTSFDASVYEKGMVVINAKILSDIVRKLPDDIVEITVNESLLTTIKCTATEFNISAIDPGEFPELPSVEKNSGFAIKNSVLKSMIGDTVFAISENENKPVHTGSLFEKTDEKLTVVSVDGYRLAIRNEPAQGEGDFRFVVPGETLKELQRILPENDSETVIYSERRYAIFEMANTVVTTRLLEGEFLNYEAAIPQDNPIKITVEKAALVEMIERVSLIISERLKNPIRCVFEGNTLKVSCVTALGKAYDEMRISDCPETVEIGFNNRYLLDALKACREEKCIIELKSGLSPCTITPVEGDKFKYLVLPVRLKAGE